MGREWWQSAAENVFLVLASVLAGCVSAGATRYVIHFSLGLGDIPLLNLSGCVVGAIVGGSLFFVIGERINESRAKRGRSRVAHSTAWGRKYL